MPLALDQSAGAALRSLERTCPPESFLVIILQPGSICNVQLCPTSHLCWLWDDPALERRCPGPQKCHLTVINTTHGVNSVLSLAFTQKLGVLESRKKWRHALGKGTPFRWGCEEKQYECLFETSGCKCKCK